MRTDNGRSTSVWMDIDDDMLRPPLEEDATADVCVVGAGIAGMSVAYECAKAGKSVIVLDDGPIGGGETCRTTAHFVTALDDRYFELEKLFGEENARLAAESHAAAIDRVERIVRDENIPCDAVRLAGYLFAREETPRKTMEEELDAAKRAGLEVAWLDETPLPAHGDTPCIRFANQFQLHPTKYLRGLAAAIEKHGGRIHCGTHAVEMENGRVKTADGKTVAAPHVVAATNSPVNERTAIHTKQGPYRTYVIGVEVPKGSVERALFWDEGDPYHYVRLQEEDGTDLLIVGGEDHKTGHANDAPLRYQRLEQWTRARFPMAKDVRYRWSGQVYEPVDSLAFIGRAPGKDERTYLATGDSGNGMTHGTIAGMLITDLILGRDNPWKELYEPSRKTPKALLEFVTENAKVMRDYCDVLTPGDVDSPDQVKPGTGAIMRKGATKIALYRDDGGGLHARTAICPHLGCVVRWNDGEKTFDCPCHGSRFTCRGDVVNGPAAVGLKEESL